MVDGEGEQIIGEERAMNLVVRVDYQLVNVVDVVENRVGESILPWPTPVSMANKSEDLLAALPHLRMRRGRPCRILSQILCRLSMCGKRSWSWS